MALTECQAHEACIEVATSTTVYKEGVPRIVLPCTCYWYIAVTSTRECLYSHTRALPFALASVVLASATLH